MRISNKMLVNGLVTASLFLTSCYTTTSKPDYAFLNLIKQQSLVNDSVKTQVFLSPREFLFGTVKPDQIIGGSFYILNIGKKDFKLVAIHTDCDCTVTNFSGKVTIIHPNDSLKISYKMNTNSEIGAFSHAISAIGNCQFGNQTYLFNGSIH